MLDLFREAVYDDKIFDNPILGKISCGSFTETYRECKQNSRKNQKLYLCEDLKSAHSKCYSSKNKEEMNKWLLQQFKENYLMIKFLQQRKSTLPEKLMSNSWSIFTNKSNLNKYEEYIKNQKI